MLLYQFFIALYRLAFNIFSLFNAKAKAGLEGRKDVLERLRKVVPKDAEVVWFHCASLGEFEQGRPLMETIKSTYPEQFILLTFFSVSGYAVQKNFAAADHVDYLPFDTKQQAASFVEIIHPQLAVFVKYEFWWNLLQQAQKRHVPVVLVSGIFRKDQYFFKSYGHPFLKILQQFKYIFVQDQASADLLVQHQCENAIVAGDTRIDRVLNIALVAKENPTIASFKGTSKLLIAGSTWEKDENLLLNLIEKLPADWKMVIAPHEIQRKGLQAKLAQQGISATTYTDYLPGEAKVLVLNTIGHLSSIYPYADLVYIGGGFDDGIHNILEPMAFQKTVLFGPNYRKFQEAVYTVAQRANFAIANESELVEAFETWNKSAPLRADSRSKIENYMLQNEGATKKIAKCLQPLLQQK